MINIATKNISHSELESRIGTSRRQQATPSKQGEERVNTATHTNTREPSAQRRSCRSEFKILTFAVLFLFSYVGRAACGDITQSVCLREKLEAADAGINDVYKNLVKSLPVEQG